MLPRKLLVLREYLFKKKTQNGNSKQFNANLSNINVMAPVMCSISSSLHSIFQMSILHMWRKRMARLSAKDSCGVTAENPERCLLQQQQQSLHLLFAYKTAVCPRKLIWCSKRCEALLLCLQSAMQCICNRQQSYLILTEFCKQSA
jgi:hypothetical protein